MRGGGEIVWQYGGNGALRMSHGLLYICGGGVETKLSSASRS